MRRLCVLIQDWSLVAVEADIPVGMPAAIVKQGHVLLANHTARAWGVQAGMRIRSAHIACPELVDLSPDAGRIARAFEPVIATVSELVAEIEVVKPGMILAPAMGPARWIGGEKILCRTLVENLVSATGVEANIGIAQGAFAASVAAHNSDVVAEEDTANYLREISIRQLGNEGFLPATKRVRKQFIAVLESLGIHTCEDLRALSREAVYARFGHLGMCAWSIAGGEEILEGSTRNVPSSVIKAQEVCDPGVQSVSAAVMVGKRLADAVWDQLIKAGMAARGVVIEAQTDRGDSWQRTWLFQGDNSAKAMTDLVRWQVQGWLEGGAVSNLACSLISLSLSVLDPYPAGIDATPLWGRTASESTARRAIARVQALLGAEAVLSPQVRGGYDPVNAVSLLPWSGEEKRNKEVSVTQSSDISYGAWEGALREDSLWPQVVFTPPIPVLVCARDGALVQVNAASEFTSVPVKVVEVEPEANEGVVRKLRDITGHSTLTVPAGIRLWQVWGQWWKETKESSEGPRAYLRLPIETGAELLLCYRHRKWVVEAIYTSPNE